MSTLKYQVFVSSTYEDLSVERSQVIKAILEMGHIPVGMEMFSAADEEQWKIIARHIDETDYYVAIVGNRYGSVTGGVSYTEKEYDYAVFKGIPALSFVIDPLVDPLAKHIDKDDGKIAALAKFKTKLKQRPVGFWKTADDLHGKVSIALMKAFNTMPRTGWTRATAVAGPEVTQELSRLSRENSELRAKLEAAQNHEAIDRRAHLQHRINTLKAIPKILQIRERGKTTWDFKAETNLFELFFQLAPEMIVEISSEMAGRLLATLHQPREKFVISVSGPIATNHVKILFADLVSLGLVEPSKKKHPVADKDSYWSLTQEGIEVLKLDRATRLEAVAAKAVLLAEASETSL